MVFYSYNSNSSNPTLHNFGDSDGTSRSGFVSSHSLVLDSEKSELVKSPSRIGKKEISEEKALAALRSHSEAERRRRERINGHLATLRGLVPCTEKVRPFFFNLNWNIFGIIFTFDIGAIQNLYSTFVSLLSLLFFGKLVWIGY